MEAGHNHSLHLMASAAPAAATSGTRAGRPMSRYESQKRRDWRAFLQYLHHLHQPPLELARCSGADVIEFLRHLDQFGKTKVHAAGCPFFGRPSPPEPCPCPLRQSWGSLDALVGRLRAAFEENGGSPDANPFGARAVRLHLKEVRDTQAKARGIAYDKKKRKRSVMNTKAKLRDTKAAANASGGGAVELSAASLGGFRPCCAGFGLLELDNVDGLNREDMVLVDSYVIGDFSEYSIKL